MQSLVSDGLPIVYSQMNIGETTSHIPPPPPSFSTHEIIRVLPPKDPQRQRHPGHDLLQQDSIVPA